MTQSELYAPTGGALSFRDLRAALSRNRWILLGSVLAGVLLSGLAAVLMRPTFESEATLRINEQMPGRGLLEDAVPAGGLSLLGLGESELDTDISVLRSRRIVDAVVDSLALHIQLLSPDTLRREVLQVVDASPESVAGTYEFRRRDDGSYELSSAKVRQANGRYTRSEPRVRQLIDPPDRVEIGRPFRMGGMTLALAPQLAARAPSTVKFRVRPFHRYVERVRENDLRVRRVDRGELVQLEYRYPDPELAAAAVNALSREFIEYKLSTSNRDAQTKVSVLEEQVAAYEDQIRQAEDALQRYQEEQLIIAPEEQATQQVERIAELQVMRDAAVVERQALANVLEETRQSATAGASPYRRLATFPSFIANGAIQNILQSLIALEGERATLLVRRTPDNADVQLLTERIADLEFQLYELGSNYLASLDQQIASANAALAGFAREVEAIPQREIEYARLSRERTLLTEVYLILQERLKEAQVLAQIERETGTVRIVDQGIVPERPVYPNTPVYLALGAVLGLMVGTMVMVGRESTSQRIHSPSDAALAGVPILGTIPRIRGAGEVNGGRLGEVRLRLAGMVTPGTRRGETYALITREFATGEGADAFRTLDANIAFSGNGTPPRVLVITSAAPAAGKSMGAANLAITHARQGHRTLLIDADLRGGTLHQIMGEGSAPGLADVLAERATVEEAIREIDVGSLTPLSFLAAGENVAPLGPGGTDVLARTFSALRKKYDSIVVDAPALDRAVDAAMLGRLADATILFVRAGATEQDELREAVEQLRRLQAPIAGVVLNEA